MAELEDDTPLQRFNTEWVDAKKGDVHNLINFVISEWGRSTRQQNMSSAISGYMAYFNRKRPVRTQGGFINITPFGPTSSLGGGGGRNIVNLNLTAICVDTLTAKLASIDVTPQVVTNKGNLKGKKLSEDLNKLVKGIFLKHELSHQINDGFKRAMITRKGAIQVHVHEDKFEFETVRLEDILIDPLDTYYGIPHKLVIRRLRPVAMMKLKYPKFKDKLDACKQIQLSVNYSHDNTPMLIEVEAWALNNYTKKGRHVVTVNNVDLIDEEYDLDYFPVLFMDYNEALVGFSGESVTDELEPLQQELNRLFQAQQHILRIVSVPRIFIDGNADVNTQHLTNMPGEIVKYNSANGVAPIIHNGAGMPPEIPAQIQNLIELAYSRVGLTTMDTQGKQLQGQGNQSGEALKTMVDIKSERWRYLEGLYLSAHIRMARLIFKMAAGKHIPIEVEDREIGLIDVNTKIIPKNIDSSAIIQVYPVSSLPDGIADRMDSVERLANMGLISRSQMYSLFKIPDLDSEVALISSPFKIVDQVLEEIIETGRYQHPEVYFDLDYNITASKRLYCWAKLNKQSEEIQKNLRRYLDDSIDLVTERDNALKAQMPLNPQATTQQQGTQSATPQAPIQQPQLGPSPMAPS